MGSSANLYLEIFLNFRPRYIFHQKVYVSNGDVLCQKEYVSNGDVLRHMHTLLINPGGLVSRR